ncbi:MAG: biotin transporter BioY [Bdellovibrionales bacterium]|nr:biotin transporter BioY [Bdellovibrionales bacterium]
MTQNSFIPSAVFKITDKSSLRAKAARHATIVFLGVALLGILAQIVIPLPFTPVPITGQTFGVALISLLLGRWHALATTVSYLGFAGLGAPILAGAETLRVPGPTVGYLLGMVASSYAIGYLSDRGWGKHFGWAFAACLIGSALVFSFGLSFLAIFFSNEHLLAAGFFPFLPGDLLKSTLAASIASAVLGKKRSLPK